MNGITIHKDYAKTIQKLTDTERSVLLNALVRELSDGDIDNGALPPRVEVLFELIIDQNKRFSAQQAKKAQKGKPQESQTSQIIQSEPNEPNNPNDTNIAKDAKQTKRASVSVSDTVLKNSNEFFKSESEKILSEREILNLSQAQASPPPSPDFFVSASRVPTLLSDAFEVTPEMFIWAEREAPGVDIAHETKKFRAHYKSSRRIDWDATWRTWILRALEFRTSGPVHKQAPVKESVEAKDEPELPPKLPPPKPNPAWTEALRAIKSATSHKCYETWFEPIIFDGADRDTLKIEVPTETLRTGILENYAPLLLRSTGAAEIDIRVGIYERGNGYA